jgi:DNA polymerase-3 subunit delta'
MFFNDVIGQDDLKQQLKNIAVNKNIPHAILFTGDNGHGTYPLAFAFARYLNCTNRSESDACGKCPSCVKYSAFAHPDLYFIFPMASNKEKHKDVCDDYLTEWRSFLKNNVYFNISMWLGHIDAASKNAIIYAAESDQIVKKVGMKIGEADYRIFIIWMPEKMHLACANKLLKLIEEPPMNTLLFMVSNQPDQILGTILSRVQQIRVPAIDPKLLAQLAKEKNGYLDDTEALKLAKQSHGNYLQLLENLHASEDNEFFLNQFILIMRNAWGKPGANKAKDIKIFAEEMAALPREKQKNFLDYCQYFTRENFIANLNDSDLIYMNQKEADFATKFAKFVNERNVFDFIDEFTLAEKHLRQNTNAKMVFFDMAIRISALLKK